MTPVTLIIIFFQKREKETLKLPLFLTPSRVREPDRFMRNVEICHWLKPLPIFTQVKLQQDNQNLLEKPKPI